MKPRTVENQRQYFRRRAITNRSFMIGLTIMTIYIVMAVFGSMLSPHDPYKNDIANKLEGFSWTNPLGRDELGRDMLSRILDGAKYSLGMAFAAVFLGLVFGVVLGSISGFFGGRLDAMIMWGVDIMLAFPSLLIAIAIISVLGRGLTNLVIAIGIASIPSFTRLVRASFLVFREEEFVKAAFATGASNSRIIFRHILPNSLTPLLVQTTYMIAGAILAASGLSFLGLGVQPPTPEWGVMLSRGRDYMRLAPFVITVPGVMIAISILGLNLLGDGLRDILDPRLID